MIQSVNKYKISEILSEINKVQYYVPKYQREYTWGRDNWENLFNDIYENEAGHFIGSIICVNKGVNALDTTPLEVIDGQQRLTTLSLLYAAIFARLSKEEKTDEEFITEKTNLKYRLIQKSDNQESIVILSSQNSNNDDYRAVLNEIGLIKDHKAPLFLGNRRLYKCFQYYKEKINILSYDQVLDFLNKANQILLVKIEVNSHSDAFILFESLNNRGVPLSAIDLIKNNVLSVLEKKQLMKIDEAYTLWLELAYNLGNDYSYQERFLRQYYNAFRYDDRTRVQGQTKATRSNIIKIFEELIDRDVIYIFDQLREKSVVYKNFIDTDSAPYNQEIRELLKDLKNIGAAPSYTFLLFLFSNMTDQECIARILNFLTKYFVRRNLTDYPATRDLDQIFVTLIDEVRKDNIITSDEIIEYLTKPDHFAQSDVFKEKLSGDIYTENVDMARFLLSSVESFHQTREHYTDLWLKDDKKYIWTIEHIFPEGDNIPKSWVAMIADDNYDEAKKIQSNYVHKIGNLTLTGFNPNLSNRPFEQKRDMEDINNNYIGYKNGMYLNEQLSTKESWTKEDIADRGEKLIQEVWNLFKLESE